MPANQRCAAWGDSRTTRHHLGLATPKPAEAAKAGDGGDGEIRCGGAQTRGEVPPVAPATKPQNSTPMVTLMLPAAVLRSKATPAGDAAAAAVRAAAEAHAELEDGDKEDETETTLPPGFEGGSPAELPSAGSALHASGACRPCGWMWKPGGCQNGRRCQRCHLCPEGELKARKKAKHALFRLGLATPKVVAGATAKAAEPRRVRFGGVATGAGKAQVIEVSCDAAPVSKDESGGESRNWKSEELMAIEWQSEGLITASWPVAKLPKAHEAAHTAELSLHALLPSEESDVTGSIRITFAAGGETAPGRLGKAVKSSRNVTFGEEEFCVVGHRESDQESTSAAGSGPDGAEETGAGSGSDTDGEKQAPGARSFDGNLLPIPPGLAPPPGTPSHGSTLHRTGACQPCAWFWKPGRCSNGRDCSYCHLCPEGELRDRKKSKHAQMRLGLITPKVRLAKPRGHSAMSSSAPEFEPSSLWPTTERFGLVTPKVIRKVPSDFASPDSAFGEFCMEPEVVCEAF